MDDKEMKLKLLLKKYTGISPKDIKLDSGISEELKLDGDDAIELLQEYSRTFDVDISRFPYQAYFCSEGFNPFAIIWNLIRPKKYKSLTVEKLLNGTITGSLT